MQNHTPGPWQPGRQADAVVALVPAGRAPERRYLEYYGGHLVAESIAACNVPLIAAAPTLLRRLQRSTQHLLAAADSLEPLATTCRVNHMRDTANALQQAVEHLRSSARLNARVIDTIRGTPPHLQEDSEA